MADKKKVNNGSLSWLKDNIDKLPKGMQASLFGEPVDSPIDPAWPDADLWLWRPFKTFGTVLNNDAKVRAHASRAISGVLNAVNTKAVVAAFGLLAVGHRPDFRAAGGPAALVAAVRKFLPEWSPGQDWNPVGKLLSRVAGERFSTIAEMNLVDILRALEFATGAPESANEGLTLIICVAKKTATLLGKCYPLTERQTDVLQKLAAAKGGFVPSDDLRSYPGSNERPDQIVKKLHKALRKFIAAKAGQGGGYRLIVQASVRAE